MGPATVVATTVHDLQVQPAGRVPCADHDVAVDLVVTPTRVLDLRRPGGGSRPVPRLPWDELTDDKVAAIPLLATLRDREGRP